MSAETSEGVLTREIRQRLPSCPDLIIREIRPPSIGSLACLYIVSIAETEQIDERIVKPLLRSRPSESEERPDPIAWLKETIPLSEQAEGLGSDEAVSALLDGCCLLVPGTGNAFVGYEARNNQYRAVSEPKSESGIRGPRDGFVESLHVNIALIRRRLKSPHLAFEEFRIGTETNTRVYMAYMSNVASEATVAEFRRRLSAIQTDGILESAYIEEYIQDTEYSPFPQLITTERPDAVTAKLLEGQVAVFVDGTPMVLVGPITFFQLFSSPEDYYQRADIATILRWLRMFSFLLSIFVPSLYIAVVSYHQELLPTPLLISLAAQREEVPFPAVVEAIIMIVTFEVLREAGLRMPRIAGQSISIVGALVIGQAAVEAGLVSAAMVIVVSLTAISNFISPMYGFGVAQRIVQWLFMLLAGVMGLFGLMCGFFFLLVHLVSLRSFGVKYMSPVAPTRTADWPDTLVRVPRPFMKRPRKSTKSNSWKR